MNALINLKGTRKNYRLANREIEVLKGIDLDVQKGRFVCIMGPSGSGKSTLLNIIGCLDRPSAGNLDSGSGREIMGIFRGLHRDGTTVLLVTHEREIAAYGERVITIRDGV